MDDRASAVSDDIEQWLRSGSPKTVGGLVEAFQEKAFAVLFVLLLGVPALPLPTGGATHVSAAIAMLLSLELIAGRREVWLPARWRRKRLDGAGTQAFVERLVRLMQRLERLSRPRARWALHHRIARPMFGATILALSLAAFLAPPFSALDTLPALGAVIVSLGVLLEDAAVVAAGLLAGAIGIVLELVVGRAALAGIEEVLSRW